MALRRFASQQLNADTWRDETLRIIVSASFLFWQQYFDDDRGAKYVRHYNVTSLPHIGLVDPVTGQLVKSWTGFKDAERLMDKLTEMADTPPTDGYAAAPEPPAAAPPSAAPLAAAQGAIAAGGDDDDELAAAIAASLGTLDDAPAAVPSEPEAEPGASWPAPPPEPEAGGDAITLRVRLPDGAQYTQRFLPEHTLRDLLCSVHHSGTPLSTRKVYQLATAGCAPVTEPDTTLGSIGLSGRVMVNISERS